MSGKLIVIEGADGAGKTVLCTSLAEYLRGQGIMEVLEIREPGGCPLSEHIRLLLKGDKLSGALTEPRAEALLFAASRAELTSTVIRPALERGAYIICDRWIHSSLVYQGVARNLPIEDIRQLSVFATDGLLADRVLCLNVSEETARGRMTKRDGAIGDRIEESTNQNVIREWYGRLTELDNHEVAIIDANGSQDEVLHLAIAALEDLLP